MNRLGVTVKREYAGHYHGVVYRFEGDWKDDPLLLPRDERPLLDVVAACHHAHKLVRTAMDCALSMAKRVAV